MARRYINKKPDHSILNASGFFVTLKYSLNLYLKRLSFVLTASFVQVLTVDLLLHDLL